MDSVSFASSSKLLELRWVRDGHRKHRQKVSTIKASHSLSAESPPKSFPHLTVRLKKLQLEEERIAEIDRQNRRLVDKLSGILMKPSQRVDNWNSYESNQLQMTQKTSERRKRQKLLMQDNQSMSNRLLNIRSSYDHSEWEKDFRRHRSIKEMLDNTTKDYKYNTGSRKGHGGSSDYESDGNADPRSRRAPSPMPSSISSSMSDPSENQQSKPWRSNAKLAKPKRAPQVLYENEARMLMKVCNKMGQANEILIKCLVKKTPRQRQNIRVRFREMYDLDLESQLTQSLSKEYRGLVEGLLHNPYLRIVSEMHANIKDVDPFALLTKCMQYDQACLKRLFDVYKKHYSTAVESDVLDFFGDPPTRALTSAALAGLLRRQPMTQADLDDSCQPGQPNHLDPDGPLLRGLRVHGPDLLAELEASGRAPTLEALGDGGGGVSLYRHLLDLATKRPHVRAVASGLEAAMSSDLKELVQLLQLLSESPTLLAEVNDHFEKSRSSSIRELLFTRCPGDTGPVIGAMLTAVSRRSS